MRLFLLKYRPDQNEKAPDILSRAFSYFMKGRTPVIPQRPIVDSLLLF